MPFYCSYPGCGQRCTRINQLETHIRGAHLKTGQIEEDRTAQMLADAVNEPEGGGLPGTPRAFTAGTFKRGLGSRALTTMRKLAAQETSWWKDLLSLWRPSGAAASTDGLRLALRSNGMNFYRKGQSVAKVSFGRDGVPFVEVHVKYAFGPSDEDGYARLIDSEIHHPNGQDARCYEGIETLRQWIRKAEEYAGEEKLLVDDLVAHASAVIDLEMGLPAFDERRRAPRIDLVALESDQGRFLIVFWEAKLIDDSRLCAHGKPEVLEQIESYREYLGDANRRERIVRAYADTCSLLVEFHGMAKQFNPNIWDLDPAVVSVAGDPLKLGVDTSPRLVIFDNGRASGAWVGHLERLRQGVGGRPIPCLVLKEEPYSLRLPGEANETHNP
jgi:hypothetical protein